MARKVILNEECCVGCGTCAELCPEVFEMDDDAEKARVVLPEGGDEECIEDAIASCPDSCIAWED
jgi:ferredoxin